MHKVFDVDSAKQDVVSELCILSGLARPLAIHYYTKNSVERCRIFLSVHSKDADKLKHFEDKINNL